MRDMLLRPWRWFIAHHRAELRRIDVRVLWPACKAEAPSLDLARAAFAVHAFNDKAWLALGEDAIRDAINGLS